MKFFKSLNLESVFFIFWIISLPVMLNRYFVPVSLFQRIQISDFIFLAIVIILLIKFLNGRIKFEIPYLLFFLLILSASFLISALKSDMLLVSLSEWSIFIYLILIYFIIVNIMKDKKIISIFLNAWLFTSLIIALLGVIGIVLAILGINNYFVRCYPSFLNKQYRLVSTMPLPNMAFAYFHVSLFLALGMFINEKLRIKKMFYLFIIFILLIAIFFTFSRGWIALFISLGIFLRFINDKKASFKLTGNIMFLIALIIFIFAQLFFTYTTDLSLSLKFGYDEKQKVDHSPEAKNRLYKEDQFFEAGYPYNKLDLGVTFLPADYWYKKKAAVKLFQRYPFFGVGPGMFSFWIKKVKERNIAYLPKNFSECDPHSTYFGALAEEGLFGLGALLILFFWFLKKLIDSLKIIQESYFKNLILSCLSAFIGLMAFGIDVDIMNFRWLWFLMGLSVAVIQIAESNDCYG